MLKELSSLSEPGGRVLFVDGDALVRRSASKGLAKGFEIEVAASAVEALRRLRYEVFDIAIVAENLPDMDGISLLSLVRSHLPTMQTILLIDDAAAAGVGVGESRRPSWDASIERGEGVSGIYDLLSDGVPRNIVPTSGQS